MKVIKILRRDPTEENLFGLNLHLYFPSYQNACDKYKMQNQQSNFGETIAPKLISDTNIRLFENWRPYFKKDGVYLAVLKENGLYYFAVIYETRDKFNVIYKNKFNPEHIEDSPMVLGALNSTIWEAENLLDHLAGSIRHNKQRCRHCNNKPSALDLRRKIVDKINRLNITTKEATLFQIANILGIQ